MTIISEKTLIPISLVVMIITVSVFIGQLSLRVSANEAKLQDQRTFEKEVLNELKSINQRLYKIEARLRIN